LHIIGGAILPLWPQLKSDRDSLLNVVRVTTDDDQRVVGILLPKNKVGPVLKALRVTRRIVAPADLARAVLEEGETLALQHGLSLKPTRMYGSPLIEVAGATHHHFAQLRATGLLNLTIDWKQRFFVPGTAERETVLTALLALYPALAPAAEGSATDTPANMALPPLTQVVAEDWVLPPAADASAAAGFSATSANDAAQPAPAATNIAHPAPLTTTCLTQTGLF
jgi:hypothetical protein